MRISFTTINLVHSMYYLLFLQTVCGYALVNRDAVSFTVPKGIEVIGLASLLVAVLSWLLFTVETSGGTCFLTSLRDDH